MAGDGGTKWSKTRPNVQDAGILLNIYMADRELPLPHYETKQDNGAIASRVRIDLPSINVSFTCMARDLTKQTSVLRCAERVVTELERRKLLDPAASTPPPPWSTSRPNEKDAGVLLNKYMSARNLPLPDYETRPENGAIASRVRITLPSINVAFMCTASDLTTQTSVLRCAERVVTELERRNLLDPAAPTPPPSWAARGCLGTTVSTSSAVAIPSTVLDLQRGTALPQCSEIDTLFRRPHPLERTLAPASRGPSAAMLEQIREITVMRTRQTIHIPAPAPPIQSTPRPPPPPTSPPPSEPPPPQVQRLFGRSDMLNNTDLYKVARQIGKYRKTLGLQLGLTAADIDNCNFKEEDPYEVNRRILRKWREKYSQRATTGVLCRALWHVQAIDALKTLL